MIRSIDRKYGIKVFPLMLWFLFHFLSAPAQTPKRGISIRLKQAGLKELTAEIEAQSGYSFIYGEEVRLIRPVTLHLEDAPLQTVLQKAFEGQDICFKIARRHIILKKAKPQPAPRRFTLNGYVLDDDSEETLIGANICDRQQEVGTTTNPFGFFSITLPEGHAELEFSYIGYASRQVSLHLCRDTLLTVRLKGNNELEEIIVLSDKAETGIPSSRMGASSIPVAHIQNTPALLSEADVLKSVQLLPGVQGGISGTSGLYVRGGSPDQNLYLLDGVPLYNVDHTLGILSIFTPESVKKADLYKSSFPARFGGRLSSVLDVRTNDGDMQHYHGSLSIGLLTSRMHFEGPLWKNRTSFIVSARRSYIDLMAKPLMSKEERGGYYLYDINAKLNHRFSDRDRLFFSLYHGKDHASYTYTNYDDYEQQDIPTSRDRQSAAWGSTLGTIRWNHVFGERLFHNITLSYNRFRFSNKNKYFLWKESFSSRYHSGIEDWGITSDFDYHPAPAHFVKFGGSYLYHTFRPEAQNTFIHTEENDKPADQVFTMAGRQAIRAHEAALYAEDDIRWNDRWKANLGAHVSLFHVQKHTYVHLEPRLSLSYRATPDFTLKAAWTHMTQYVHLLSSTQLSLPTDLWVPVTRHLRPMQARQFSAGSYYTGFKGWELSVEGYYKTIENVLEYKDGTHFYGNSIDWEDRVEMGTGRHFGIEFMVEKKTGRTTGWINYTLAKADRKFTAGNVNQGKRFPSAYDRRHTVNISLSHRIGKRTDMNASWTYASGNAVTLPKEYATLILPEGTNRPLIVPARYSSTRNNYRLPASHQLNLGFNFHRKTRHGERIWNVSLFNAYNALNPNYVFIDYYTDNQEEGKRIPVIQKVTLIPFLPSFSYTYKF